MKALPDMFLLHLGDTRPAITHPDTHLLLSRVGFWMEASRPRLWEETGGERRLGGNCGSDQDEQATTEAAEQARGGPTRGAAPRDMARGQRLQATGRLAGLGCSARTE